MIKKIDGILRKLDLVIKAFNFGFFLVSLMVWLYLTVLVLMSKPFGIGLLWEAFNLMYANLSFKVGCIFLILFNGLNSFRSWIFKYHDFKELIEHSKVISKIIKVGKR